MAPAPRIRRAQIRPVELELEGRRLDGVLDDCATGLDVRDVDLGATLASRRTEVRFDRPRAVVAARGVEPTVRERVEFLRPVLARVLLPPAAFTLRTGRTVDLARLEDRFAVVRATRARRFETDGRLADVLRLAEILRAVMVERLAEAPRLAGLLRALVVERLADVPLLAGLLRAVVLERRAEVPRFADVPRAVVVERLVDVPRLAEVLRAVVLERRAEVPRFADVPRAVVVERLAAVRRFAETLRAVTVERFVALRFEVVLRPDVVERLAAVPRFAEVLRAVVLERLAEAPRFVDARPFVVVGRFAEVPRVVDVRLATAVRVRAVPRFIARRGEDFTRETLAAVARRVATLRLAAGRLPDLATRVEAERVPVFGFRIEATLRLAVRVTLRAVTLRAAVAPLVVERRVRAAVLERVVEDVLLALWRPPGFRVARLAALAFTFTAFTAGLRTVRRAAFAVVPLAVVLLDFVFVRRDDPAFAFDCMVRPPVSASSASSTIFLARASSVRGLPVDVRRRLFLSCDIQTPW